MRDDDIPAFVSTGVSDLGIVGLNEVHEYRATHGDRCLHIEEYLGFSRCRLSLAVPHDTSYTDLSWFDGKKIATSYPASLQQFIDTSSISAEIVVISGSVESMPAMQVADAVCDLVATGSSLALHNLREVCTLLESEAVMVSAPQHLGADKKKLLNRFCQRVKGVLKAERSKYVMMNAPYGQLEKIKKVIPGLHQPTVMPLFSEDKNGKLGGSVGPEDYVAVHVVAQEPVFWSTIEELKSLGAQSVLVVPIEKIIE